LGITVDAVRSRIKRGTIAHERKGGRVYVLLGADESRPGHAQDTDQGGDHGTTAPEDRTAELIATLQEQLQAERQAHAEARRIIAGLVERIPAIEAPQEASETAETVEEEPERAEPHAATGGAEEGTERPQQQSGRLVPVDKLPWWHYVIGIVAVFLATFFPPAANLSAIRGEHYQTMPRLPLYVILFGAAWAVTGAFGFWVGFRQRITRFWPQNISIGAVVGAVAGLGIIAYLLGVRGLTATDLRYPYIVGFLGLYALPAWLLFVSGSLIGNAWQRRRNGRISGITPASPTMRTTPGSAQPREDWSPRKQAILGWSGTIISALITLVGTIVTVKGGP
jgi:hypothetical protein